MKLPNAHQAVVPTAKLVAYLLSTTHPVGRAKARFFRTAGFEVASAPLLEQGLLAIARDEDVVTTMSSPHGEKYIIDGTLATPLGGSIRVRTVWIIEPSLGYPRFVTAFPA